MDPNVRVVSPHRGPINYPYPQGYHHPGYHTSHTSRMYKVNHSISPVRYRNEFGLENSRMQEQYEYVERKPSEIAKMNLDKKGYVTEATSPAQPYKPFQKKKDKGKQILNDKWTGYTTTNYEEEKVKKDKLDRRR